MHPQLRGSWSGDKEVGEHLKFLQNFGGERAHQGIAVFWGDRASLQ